MAKYALFKKDDKRWIVNNKTKETIFELENPKEYNRLRKLAINNHKRRLENDVYKSLGLTKVKGLISGKTYWE